MANNPSKNDIDLMILERHLSGQTLSWMEGMSLETPDVVEWTREKLTKLIAASKEVNAPDIRQPLTDIIIDTGLALVKLGKSQQKILGITADEGTHVKKEAQKRLHKKAAKLLGSLARQLSDLAYKLEHRGYEIQAQIGDAYRETRNEGKRLLAALGFEIQIAEKYHEKLLERLHQMIIKSENEEELLLLEEAINFFEKEQAQIEASQLEPTKPTIAKDDCEERLEILHEHMAASKSEEERQFISEVIDFVKTSQTQAREAPKLALTMLEMEAFKTTLEKDFLISIRNIQKLAGEQANGLYL